MNCQTLFGFVMLFTFLQEPSACFGEAEKRREVQMELDRLQGTWKLIDYRFREPPNRGVLNFRGKFSGTLVIKNNKAQLKLKVLNFNELDLNPKIVVRPTLNPKEWDFVYADPKDPEKTCTTRFIYQLKGDKLNMLFYPDPKTKERPKGFDKPVAKSQTMMVWKRIPKDD